MDILSKDIEMVGSLDKQLSSIMAEIVEKKEICFSSSWYLQHFPSTCQLPIEPKLHYEKFGYLQGLSPHPLFDPNWYLIQNHDVREAGAEPFEHFLQHGHKEGRNPHPLIDLQYIARQIKGGEPQDKPLDYYLKFGFESNISPHPLVDMKWFKLNNEGCSVREPLLCYSATTNKRDLKLHPLIDFQYVCDQLSLLNESQDDPLHAILNDSRGKLTPHAEYFDSGFYLSKNKDVKESGINPLLHYLADGWKERREPTRHFHSQYSRFVDFGCDPDGQACIVEFLNSGRNLSAVKEKSSHFLNVVKRVKFLSKSLAPNSIVELIKRYEQAHTITEPKSEAAHEDADFWAVLSSYYHYKSGDIEAARKVLTPVRASFSKSPEADIINQLLLANSKRSTSGYFRAAESKTGLNVIDAENRTVVYTALFGDFDRLQPVLIKPKGIDFVCFTDQDVRAEGWTIVPMERTGDNDNLEAKAYKVFPWKYLADYDYSLFVDSNTLFTGDIGNLINTYLLGEEFSAWEHPERDNLVDECFAIFLGNKFEKSAIFAQLDAYLSQDGLNYQGVIEASFLWRSHHSKAVKELMENWWEQINEFTSRDQLSLTHLMNKGSVRPNILSSSLGNSRENLWFVKIPHQNSSEHRTFNDGVVDIKSKSPVKAVARRKIVFVYHQEFRFSGATIMRCFQAADVLERSGEGKYGVSLSCSLDISGSFVYLSKGMLKKITQQEIADLHRKGNIIFADFVDDPVRQELLPWVDALLASSMSAYSDFVRRFPSTYVHHLVHMVDTRLPEMSRHSELRVGYFGEMPNTVVTDNIVEHVDFVSVNTKVSNPAWLKRVADYNCHYCVRQTREIDAFKPFLKGFTAAHFEAPILVDKRVKEAQIYLGNDYPYISDSSKENSILELLEFAKISFGSPVWLDAVDRLRHLKSQSSAEHYVNEFQNLLDCF